MIHPSTAARDRSAIIAVGDELLGGFTVDTNSHWLAGQLRECGLPPVRIAQVPDRPERIREELERTLADPEVGVVFLCGGLGPTPDDRTLEALAAFLGRALVQDPDLLERVHRAVHRLHEHGLLEDTEPGPGMLKLALIPEGPDDVLHNPAGSCPGLLYRVSGGAGAPVAVFVLPGVPEELRAIFAQVLLPRHFPERGPGHVAEHAFAHLVEARFYEVLREVEVAFPDVTIGSYPQRATREVIIRVTGRDGARVREALDMVVTRMTPA